jgi:hypothetical protein
MSKHSPFKVSQFYFSSKTNPRIQMELDSRKNEAKADLKQQDINIEVSATKFPIITIKLKATLFIADSFK